MIGVINVKVEIEKEYTIRLNQAEATRLFDVLFYVRKKRVSEEDLIFIRKLRNELDICDQPSCTQTAIAAELNAKCWG